MSQNGSEREKVRIIIKRVVDDSAQHHGGAWKIAYADFVTAMMAFFMLMWLLGSVGKYELQGIEAYFKDPKAAMAGKYGTNKGILQGGGPDAERSIGATRKNGGAQKALDSLTPEMEKAKFKDLVARLQKAIDSKGDLRSYKNQLQVEMTGEGLRIQIKDDLQRPMFDVGSSTLKPYAKSIIKAIADELKDSVWPIAIAGHTDSRQYSGGGFSYSNWELSSDRANASRRELLEGGIPAQKIAKITGFADSQPISGDTLSDSNRRISFLLLNKRSIEREKESSKKVALDDDQKINPSAALTPIKN